jgi:hypothetical protein
MGTESIGVLVQKLSLDMAEFEVSIRKAETLSKALKTSIRDLGTLSVPAALPKSVDDYSVSLNSGEKAVRGFLREQRLQDRVMRESIGSITGVVFAFAFLTRGAKDAKDSTRLVTDSLVAAMGAANATEFAMFSLGRAFPALAAFSGPITVLAAVLAAVGSLFASASSEAATLAEKVSKLKVELGIKSSEQRMGELDAEEIKARAELDRAQRRATGSAQMDRVAKGGGPIGQWATLMRFVDSMLGVDNEVARAEAKLLEITKERSDLQDKIWQGKEAEAKATNTANQTLLDLNRENEAAKNKSSEESDKSIREAQDAYFTAMEKQAHEEARMAEETVRVRDSLRDITDKARAEGIETLTEKELLAEEARYNREVRNIDELARKSVANAEDVARAKTANEIGHAQRVEQIKRDAARQTTDEALQGAEYLASALSSAFARMGNTASANLMQVLQIAIRIAQQIASVNAAQAAGQGTVGGYLGILGSLVGLIGMFDRGGYTGSGTRYQPAGLVHRGEIVFEKPLVDRHGAELMALRSSLQHSYASGGYVGGGAMVGGAMVVVGRVDIDNGKIFLRRQMPGFDKWNRKKIA